jgi:hypothetical protein
MPSLPQHPSSMKLALDMRCIGEWVGGWMFALALSRRGSTVCLCLYHNYLNDACCPCTL